MRLKDYELFSDPSLLILTSLAAGEKHGYAILQDIESFFGVKLGPGTLYGSLTRLESKGLIMPVPSDDRRRPYRLTAKGTASLQTHLDKLAALAVTGQERLSTT